MQKRVQSIHRFYLSTAYKHDGLGQSTGYDYTRTKNPTRTILEEGIANLESGDRVMPVASVWRRFN